MARASSGTGMYGLGPKKMLKTPGRKGLDEIVKLNLFEDATPDKCASLWNDHHIQYAQYYGRVLEAPAYEAIRPRLAACPYFVIPVFRDKGLFNVVTNFSNDIMGVVPLAEFQKHQDNAEIHMTVQFFTELAVSKGLVLVRCEIQDKVLMRKDCIFITKMVLKYYTMQNLFEPYVEAFNKRPNSYDYHALLRHMQKEAGQDNIEIKDRKQELRRDAYKGLAQPLAAPLGGGAAAAAEGLTLPKQPLLKPKLDRSGGISLPSASVASAIKKSNDSKATRS
jgi:hypothetical protein